MSRKLTATRTVWVQFFVKNSFIVTDMLGLFSSLALFNRSIMVSVSIKTVLVSAFIASADAPSFTAFATDCTIAVLDVIVIAIGARFIIALRMLAPFKNTNSSGLTLWKVLRFRAR